MEPEPEQFEVLSEVHLDEPPCGQSNLISRFTAELDCGLPPSLTPHVDVDGDIEVVRQRRRRHVFNIPHAMATPLANVGLQVWAGALLMCDWIISTAKAGPACRTVLELGAGVGLASIVAAAVDLAQVVLCTDQGDQVLENCQRAVKLNRTTCGKAEIRVRELDWANPGVVLNTIRHEVGEGVVPDDFNWNDEDRAEFLKGCTLLLAADCVYMDEATSALADCVHMLLTAPGIGLRELIVATEKRINFTLRDLRTRAPAHEHFERVVLQSPRFEAKQLPLDFPQCFRGYTRTPELQLWRIRAR